METSVVFCTATDCSKHYSTIIQHSLDLIFVGNYLGKEAAAAVGVSSLIVTCPFYWIYVILEVLGDTIRGAGKANPPMVIILSNICVLRIILLFVIMASYHDVRGVAITYPITWATTALCMLVYYLKGNWTKSFNY